MYTVPTVEGGAFTKIAALKSPIQSGYDDGDGTFYGFSLDQLYGIYLCIMDEYSLPSWEHVRDHMSSGKYFGTAISLDPTSGKVYGSYLLRDDEQSAFVWGSVDYTKAVDDDSDPVRDPIVQLEEQFMGLGADKDGQFYGVTYTGKFVKVDKLTGAVTLIKETGLPMKYLAGGCVNNADDTFLQAYCNDTSSGLAEIDLATGEVKNIVPFANNEQVTTLYIPTPAARDKAPAVPQLIIATDKGSKTYTATITMPTMLFDGTPLAAGKELTYSLTAGKTVVAEGTATPGEVITKTITATEDALIEFAATATNEDGRSPKAHVTQYIGNDTPKAPADVAMTLDEGAGTATITWKAVTEGENNGYLDLASLTYTVYDIRNRVVKENVTGTSATVECSFPSNGTFNARYQVKTVCNGHTSKAGVSNRGFAGTYSVPMTMDLTDKSEFDIHPICDANNDKHTWQFSTNITRYLFNVDLDGDDWLF